MPTVNPSSLIGRFMTLSFLKLSPYTSASMAGCRLSQRFLESSRCHFSLPILSTLLSVARPAATPAHASRTHCWTSCRLPARWHSQAAALVDEFSRLLRHLLA